MPTPNPLFSDHPIRIGGQTITVAQARELRAATDWKNTTDNDRIDEADALYALIVDADWAFKGLVNPNKSNRSARRLAALARIEAALAGAALDRAA